MYPIHLINWDELGGMPTQTLLQLARENPGDGQIASLAKALLAGNDVNNPGAAPGVGFPIRVEDLDPVLRILTYQEPALVTFRMVAKKPVFNTVHEYNLLNSYGDRRLPIFGSETALPEPGDSTYERKTVKVKYAMRRREVSVIAGIVRSAIGNTLAAEAKAGTMELLGGIESALWYGDSSLDPLQWDGFEKLLIDGGAEVVDKLGQPLTQDDAIDGPVAIADADRWGRASHWFTNLRHKADLAKLLFPGGRYDMNGNKPKQIGGRVESIETETGEVTLVGSTFLDFGVLAPTTAAAGDSAKRPATPTISTGQASPVDGTASFTLDSDAGAYFLTVEAWNTFGHSAPVVVNAGALTVSKGDAITFGVTPGGANSPATLWWQVYRTPVGGAASTKKLVLRVVNAAGAAETLITEKNVNRPNTVSAYLVEGTPETMYVGQLAPLLQTPLGAIDLTHRKALMYFAVPVYTAPRRARVYRNVGRPANAT